MRKLGDRDSHKAESGSETRWSPPGVSIQPPPGVLLWSQSSAPAPAPLGTPRQHRPGRRDSWPCRRGNFREGRAGGGWSGEGVRDREGFRGRPWAPGWASCPRFFCPLRPSSASCLLEVHCWVTQLVKHWPPRCICSLLDSPLALFKGS